MMSMDELIARARHNPRQRGGGSQRYVGSDEGKTVLSTGIALREIFDLKGVDLWDASHIMHPGWSKDPRFKGVTVESYNTKVWTASEHSNPARIESGRERHNEHPKDRYPHIWEQAVANVRAKRPMTVAQFLAELKKPETIEHPRYQRRRK